MQTFTKKEREDGKASRLLNEAGSQISLAHAIDNLSQVFLTAHHFTQDPESVELEWLDIYKPENRTPTALQRGTKLHEDLREIANWLAFNDTQAPPPSRLHVAKSLQDAYNFLNPDNAQAKHHAKTIAKAFEVFELGEVQSPKTERG